MQTGQPQRCVRRIELKAVKSEGSEVMGFVYLDECARESMEEVPRKSREALGPLLVNHPA